MAGSPLLAAMSKGGKQVMFADAFPKADACVNERLPDALRHSVVDGKMKRMGLPRPEQFPAVPWPAGLFQGAPQG